jgi:hypothetical protein
VSLRQAGLHIRKRHKNNISQRQPCVICYADYALLPSTLTHSCSFEYLSPLGIFISFNLLLKI